MADQLNLGIRTLQEWAMGDELTLATLHETVLSFLSSRSDIVVYGAHAVNAYVTEPRMTQDVDVLSTDAAGLARELGDHLHSVLGIAVRVRDVGAGRGYRIYQLRKPANRHIADVRVVDRLPPSRVVAGLRVIAPDDLVALKVIALHSRRGTPKSGTDWRDIAVLLMAMPDLKSESGSVAVRLVSLGADQATMDVWTDIVRQDLRPEDEDYDVPS